MNRCIMRFGHSDFMKLLSDVDYWQRTPMHALTDEIWVWTGRSHRRRVVAYTAEENFRTGLSLNHEESRSYEELYNTKILQCLLWLSWASIRRRVAPQTLTDHITGHLRWVCSRPASKTNSIFCVAPLNTHKRRCTHVLGAWRSWNETSLSHDAIAINHKWCAFATTAGTGSTRSAELPETKWIEGSAGRKSCEVIQKVKRQQCCTRKHVGGFETWSAQVCGSHHVRQESIRICWFRAENFVQNTSSISVCSLTWEKRCSMKKTKCHLDGLSIANVVHLEFLMVQRIPQVLDKTVTDLCAKQFRPVVHGVSAWQSGPSDIFLARWPVGQERLKRTTGLLSQEKEPNSIKNFINITVLLFQWRWKVLKTNEPSDDNRVEPIASCSTSQTFHLRARLNTFVWDRWNCFENDVNHELLNEHGVTINFAPSTSMIFGTMGLGACAGWHDKSTQGKWCSTNYLGEE